MKCKRYDDLSQLGKELIYTPVGESCHGFEVRRYEVSGSYNSYVCLGCAFRKPSGAACCEFSVACMAHFRPDRESVIFAKV